MQVDRRAFIAAGAAGALAPAGAFATEAGSPVLAALSGFAPRFMAARNAPGMILGIAGADGRSETAAYGFADLEARRPIGPRERFHIGSISKSFTALMILQLAEEGRLALDADIRDILPGLPLKTPFGRVTVHHLLCHSAGLPGSGASPGWPDQSVEQVYVPGSRFYYSNLGYAWLGRIVVARGGEAWTRALHRRILDPLGMTETSAVIGAGMRQFEVPSYVRRDDDRPFPRRGALIRAAPLTFTDGSGCIASTAADMNKYIAMLARRGQGPRGRLLSPQGFALMTTRHIDAEEFGPGAGYGYGWATDKIDGAAVIRHTGGMVSFMSSLHVDLDAGFGAFASINAQQGYRPVPVTACALGLHRASVAKVAAPKAPDVDPDAGVAFADYAGDYRHADGRMMTVTAGASGLTLAVGGQSFPLESLGGGGWVCTAPAYRLFSFLFTRALTEGEAAKGAPNPVVALSWARDTYVRRGAKPPAAAAGKAALPPEQLASYEGLYALGSPWISTVRLIARDGRLWIEGYDSAAMPLAYLGADRFRFAVEAAEPEIVAFTPASASPRAVSLADTTLVRLGEPFMELV